MLNSALNDLKSPFLAFFPCFIRQLGKLWGTRCCPACHAGGFAAGIGKCKILGGLIAMGEETGDASKDFIMGYI